MYTGAPSGGGFGDVIGLLMAGSAIYLFITLAIVFIGYYIAYRIVRAGVRDGMADAIRKSGGTLSGGGPGFVQGYPPAQNYGAPVAPHAEQSHQGYVG
jgi:hypothetical protein